MYPLVELATALSGPAWSGVTGFGSRRCAGAVFFTILLGIAMTDARDYIIPDEFSLGGLVIGLLFALAPGRPASGTALLGAAVGFGLLWMVGVARHWVFKQDAMGGGDIKMMAMVGAFLGWQGVLLTMFLGALIGTLIFVPLTLVGHKKLVPFGIFLALGAAATYLVGPGARRLVHRRTWRRMSARGAPGVCSSALALGRLPRQQRAPAQDAVLARLVDSLRAPVERAAGLNFRTPPRSALRCREQVRAYLVPSSTRSCRPRGCAGSRPPTGCSGSCPIRSPARAAARSLREQVAGYYDPDSAMLFGVAGADRAPAPAGPGARDGARASGPVPAARLDPQVYHEQRPAHRGAVDSRGQATLAVDRGARARPGRDRRR